MRDKRYVVHSKKNENSETTISSTIQDSRQWTNYAALLSKDCRYHFHSFCFIFTGSTNFMVSFVYFMHALDFFVSTAHWSILTLKKWQPAIQNATGMRIWNHLPLYPLQMQWLFTLISRSSMYECIVRYFVFLFPYFVWCRAGSKIHRLKWQWMHMLIMPESQHLQLMRRWTFIFCYCRCCCSTFYDKKLHAINPFHSWKSSQPSHYSILRQYQIYRNLFGNFLHQSENTCNPLSVTNTVTLQRQWQKMIQ